MPAYEFITIWRISAPIKKVWEEIYHSENWPSWWRGVVEVTEIKKGDDLGVGSIRRYKWKSMLPYTLTFNVEIVRVEPMSVIEGAASGELEGRGIWNMSEEGDVTIARYDWRVSTSKPWMNVIAPVAKPLFKWNHDIIMGWGAEGLSKRMNAQIFEGK